MESTKLGFGPIEFEKEEPDLQEMIIYIIKDSTTVILVKEEAEEAEVMVIFGAIG